MDATDEMEESINGNVSLRKRNLSHRGNAVLLSPRLLVVYIRWYSS